MKSFRAWILLLTLWFALLQTIAPLMHAHVAGDTAADHGPHMHMVDIPALHAQAEPAQQTFHWHMHSNKSHGQIIGLGQAISESNDLLTLITAHTQGWLVAVLPAIYLLSLLSLTARPLFRRQQNTLIPPPPRTARHAPRGPPHA